MAAFEENWLKARREVELLCMTFEPVPESRRLDEAIEVEAAAWVRMKEFIDAPRTRRNCRNHSARQYREKSVVV